MLSHDQVQAHSCPLLTATVSPHRLDEQQQPAKTSGSVRREHTSPSTAHREQWSCLSPAGKQSQLRPGTVHSFVATQIPGKDTHNHPKLSKAATHASGHRNKHTHPKVVQLLLSQQGHSQKPSTSAHRACFSWITHVFFFPTSSKNTQVAGKGLCTTVKTVDSKILQENCFLSLI